MQHQRVIHEAAWAMATEVVAIFGNLLREEEKIEAFREIYEVQTKGLRKYQEALEHLHRRLYTKEE